MGEENFGDYYSVDELYKFALIYFKENEGRNFHVQFDEKLELVALTQQANHGNIKNASLPPLGALDVIGKQRRSAWADLGDMNKSEAKKQFVQKLTCLVPNFQSHIKEKSQKEIERRKEEEMELLKKVEEEKQNKEIEDRKQKEELERRKIKDALNGQTFEQFKRYAEQQYPDNPDQQALLIKQLQEQHYHQYMHQLVQQQAAALNQSICQQAANNLIPPADTDGQNEKNDELNVTTDSNHHQANLVQNGGSNLVENTHTQHLHHNFDVNDADDDIDGEEGEEMVLLGQNIHYGEEAQEVETNLSMLDINKTNIEELEAEEANMWTRKDINDFKESIKKDESDAILKVGHGETVTIRVPTHQDGKALYWEFATDHYDIGFGVFFEWVEPEDTQVTVHVSDSEDEDEDEIFEDDGEADGRDPESRGQSYTVDNGPPTSCIVPIYRRDCHEEVYSGCHNYPSQGVYLLKFDNSYSLWRSKTLYYRVYYTR